MLNRRLAELDNLIIDFAFTQYCKKYKMPEKEFQHLKRFIRNELEQGEMYMDFNNYLYSFYGGIGADDLTDDDWDMLYAEYQEFIKETMEAE